MHAATFSLDGSSGLRMIGEIFAIGSQRTSKTIALRHLHAAQQHRQCRDADLRATKEIARVSFNQIEEMNKADPLVEVSDEPYLPLRFHLCDHLKIAECVCTSAVIKVKTFEIKIVTESIPVLTIVDKLHLFLGAFDGSNRVIRQIRGDMLASPKVSPVCHHNRYTDIFRDQ